MTEGVILSFTAGVIAGALYFAGLWMTVRRLPGARRPLLFLAGSTVVRLGLLLGAVYLVMDGRWERLAACLLGVIVARSVLLVLRRRLPRPADT